MIDPKQFATELRIGNWLNPSEPEFKGKYFQIDAGDIKHIRDGMRMYKYEPIPISIEILKACGFQKQEPPFERCFLKDHYNVQSLTNTFVFVLNNGFAIEVESLHQLQNLYFVLTSKELNYQPNVK